jgi:predicted RNA-binding Zn-ribbon protein involved in translation (DUF1610 family)
MDCHTCGFLLLSQSMTQRRCPQCDSTIAVVDQCRECGYSFQIEEDAPAVSGLFGIWAAVFALWMIWQVMSAMVFFYHK